MDKNLWNKAVGRLGESIAKRYLEEKGYLIEARNYTVRGGEIDLIALKSGILYFIEVKTRITPINGEPIEAITKRKNHCLRKAAWKYLNEFNAKAACLQFDLVTINLTPRNRKANIRHIENFIE